jgi:protein-glutamine gamma-glutamyltransferase
MKFGRAHRILTSLLAAFGLLALLSVAPFGGVAVTSAPFVVVVVLAAAQVVLVAARRGAVHDTPIFVLALLHLLAAAIFGGGLLFLVAFVGIAFVLPAALVLSHLRREVEGNYQQGARDRTGLPVDVPRILRSRRVLGRGSLAALLSLALPILAVTALFFLVLPRWSARGSWLAMFGDPRAGLVHFSDAVDLGQHGAMQLDPAVALRFRVAGAEEAPPARMPLRFRGAVLDGFDGRAWTRTRAETAMVASDDPILTLVRAPDLGRDRAVTIEREAFGPPVLLVPSGTVAVGLAAGSMSASAIERTKAGELSADVAATQAVRYTAYIGAGDVDAALSAAERARDLALPLAPSARLRDLAHRWSDDEPTSLGKARAIEQHLRSDFAYDLASPSRGAPDPLDHFLFESKRGHCELFASTMAVMLRAVGIPAREVTGFVGGTYNRFGGYYVVRQSEAHAWIEAYADGWRTFDPTPVSPLDATATNGFLASTRDLGDVFAQRYGGGITSYDGRAQASIVATLRLPIAMSLLLGVVVAIVAARALRRGRPRRSPGGAVIPSAQPPSPDRVLATTLYASLEAALVAHGIVRDPAVPPLAHATRLQAAGHPLAGDVTALTNLYLEARFGGRPLTRTKERAWVHAVTRIRSLGTPSQQP